MSEQNTTNIVPFDLPGRAAQAESPFDAPILLAGCRDRLAYGAATAFAEHLARAADNLLTLADRATSSQAQGLCLAAHKTLTTRGPELLQQFRLEFVSACDAAFLSLDRPMIQPATMPFSELCLVADEDFERELTIDRLSSRADYNCSQQLTALDRRIAALRQGRRITQADNPLYPKAVFTGFLAACRAQGIGDEVDLTLLQELGHPVADALPRVYQEINRYLAEQKVLPNLPLGGALPREPGTPPAEGLTAAAVGGTSPTAASVGLRAGAGEMVAPAGYASPEDIFAQIANNLLASQPLPPRGSPFGSGQIAAPAYAPGQVIEALTQLQRGVADTQYLPGIDPQHIDPTAGHLLRRIRSTPLIAWSHPMDAVTVDVVAMLFDLILNDRELPDALRAQIGRLQIPILKVAMMDKGFFSDRQHPARRFLDALAGAANGWEEDDLPRLIDRVQTIIEVVLDGFDKDTEIFSSQLAALQAFLAAEEAQVTETASRLRSEVELEERRALAGELVEGEIQRHEGRPDLPDLIRDFLDRIWRVVLTDAYVRSGETGQAWKDATATMDDLAWSVIPKASAEERRRLLELLPGLLAGLRRGLAAVDMEEEWDGFFARLIHMHVEAVHPSSDDRGGTVGPTGETEPKPQPGITPAEDSNPAGDSLAETQERQRQVLGSKAERDAHYLELARGLKVGAWVEFRSERGTRRALRLNWCSQQRGAYLFSNLQGDGTLIVATTSLAEQLRDGSARLLSREGLTERAVNQLLTSVVGRPAAASTA